MRTGTDVPLVGRDGELSAVGERLALVTAGAREAILFEGEAGIGKTRLMRECIERADVAGFTVIQGAGSDVDQARAYGAILNALESSAPEVIRRLEALPTEPSDRRLAFVDALVSYLDETTRAAPVALVMDDLHWADAETLRALRALVRRTASTPFFLVATCRPSIENSELEALIETVDYEGLHIDLAPLDEAAVATLVEELADGPLPPEARARVASARGNPFFVIEIVSTVGEELEGSDIPRGLRRTVLRRIMQLSADARSLLRLASLLGTTIDPEELAGVTGRPVVDLLSSLDEAVKARVLEEHEGSLVFRHDLVREAIYTDMPVSLRKKLHREAARALAASGTPARLVATHLGAAADANDGEAISWLRRAAAEEMHRSPTLSADMLGRAAGLMGPAEPALEEVQAERVQALVWGGRVSEASAVARDALPSLRDPSLASDVRLCLGQALFFQGRIQESAELFQAAATDAHDADRGLVHAEASLAMLLAGQLEQADSFAQQALAEAESTKDPRALSLATAVRAAHLLANGDTTAIDVARGAVQIAEEDFLGEAHRYGAPAILGYVLAEMDMFRDAAAALRRGIELDQERGITWALPVYHSLLGLQHFFAGEWDDSVAELETVKGLHEDMDSSLFGPLAHGVLANIAVHRSDLERAEAEVAWGEQQLGERGPQEGVEYLMSARILLAEAKGDNALALGVAKTACQISQSMGLLLAFRYFAPPLARLAKTCGAPEESRFAVEAAEAYAERSGVPSAAGTARLSRGILESASEVLLDAARILNSEPRPLELATAHEHAGLSLISNGETKRGAEELEEAAAIYERLGARLDVARVAEALGSAGSKRDRARGARPVRGWESLSPTEARVAALVAEGLSNGAIADRLVVSRRTVETHVYHVFQKLGVSSRTELAARAPREATAEVQ